MEAAARDSGSAAITMCSLKPHKYSRTGTGACLLVPLNHERFGRAGPATFADLNEIVEFAARSGGGSK